MRVINARIQFDRTGRGEETLEAGNFVKGETEQLQPVDEQKPRESAECRELIDARIEITIADRIVDVVLNVMEASEWQRRDRLA